MSRFLESIKIINGQPVNLKWHQERVNSTFRHFFPDHQPYLLSQLQINSELNNDIIYKCRFIYDHQTQSQELIPYQQKTLSNFKLIESGNLNYQFKFADRGVFQDLLTIHSGYDELILMQNGLITDCTYANLVFENQHGLFTPRTPLLAGTMRAKLLSERKIQLADINRNSLLEFSHFYLINAMIGEMPVIRYSVKQIDFGD